MCRLLAYAAPEPISLIDVLGEPDFEQFTALTSIHSDGWGMAWHDHEGVLRHTTSTTCAQHDPRFHELAEQPLGRAGIVHLRWATPGIPRSPANTHPFVDGDLAMAHNGNITPIGELDQLLTPNSRAALRGDTDSERYFRYLVQNIRDSNDEVGAVRDAVARLAQRFPTASLNALLLTGTHLFAVHINSHATPPPALKGLGIAAERLRHTDDQYFGMDFRRVDAQTQIISSGISPVGWSDIPLDALGILDLATNELTWTRETATSVAGAMGWTVTAEIIEWHGPAPYYFLPLDEDDSADFKIEAAGLEYWGQVAVIVTIGDTTFKTAVFPKDGRYLVPLRAAIRQAEGLELGAEITAIVQLDRDRKTR